MTSLEKKQKDSENPPPIIELSEKNIATLNLKIGAQELIGKSLTGQGFDDKGSIYAIASMSHAEVKARLSQGEREALTKKFSKHSYGASALHWAILNPDINVFKEILKFFKDNNIDIQSLQYTSDKRKTKYCNNLMIHKGDSLFNLAFSILDKEKMALLLSENLGTMNCPILLKNTTSFFNPFYYKDSKNQCTYQSDMLDYCSFLILKKYNKKVSCQDNFDFYLNFALSFKTFEQYMGFSDEKNDEEKSVEQELIINLLEKKFPRTNSFHPEAIHTQYLHLLSAGELYNEKKFITVFIPFLFKDFKKHFNSIRILQNVLIMHDNLGRKCNYFDSIVSNFIDSKYALDKEAQSILKRELNELKDWELSIECVNKGKNVPIKIVILEAIELLQTGIEKKLLSQTITQTSTATKGHKI